MFRLIVMPVADLFSYVHKLIYYLFPSMFFCTIVVNLFDDIEILVKYLPRYKIINTEIERGKLDGKKGSSIGIAFWKRKNTP